MPFVLDAKEYYKRFWRQARADLFKWGRQQVIGVILAVSILAFQIYYKIIPESLTLQAVESVGWPYLLLIVLLMLTAVLKAPVELDNQRAAEVREQVVAAQRWEDAVNELKAAHEAQIQALTPKRKNYSPGDETIVRQTLRMLGPQTWDVFRYLLECESEDDLALFSKFGTTIMARIIGNPIIETVQIQGPPLPIKTVRRIPERFKPIFRDFFDEWSRSH